MLNKRDNPQGFPTLSQVLEGKTQDERFSIYEDHYYTLNQYRSNYSLKEVQEIKDLEKSIGVPILIYIKAMFSGVWIKGMEREWGGVGNKRDIAFYQVEDLNANWMVVRFSSDCDAHFIDNPMKSYGKVWALTYDELWTPNKKEREQLEKDLQECIKVMHDLEEDKQKVGAKIAQYCYWKTLANVSLGVEDDTPLEMNLDEHIKSENDYYDALNKHYLYVFEQYHKILKKLGRE